LPYNLKLEKKFSLPDNYKLDKVFANTSLKWIKYNDWNIFSWYTIWNRNIDNNNFAKAKKRLEREVYNGVDLALRTFYCNCDYNNKNNKINHKSCGLEHDGRYVERYRKRV